MRIISLALAICCLWTIESSSARRVQISSRVAEPLSSRQNVYYEDEDDEYTSSLSEEPIVYKPRTRALHTPRSKDTLQSSKVPPVQTIRNYNKVNDDGSFTFGYEAADGSFKEETRGTDCVVRGKYGYVDPDGNKREFTYVSGNPCDPNALREEDDDELLPNEKNNNRDDDISEPANYPSIRPVARPVTPRAENYRTLSRQSTTTQRSPTTIFQNDYRLTAEADEDVQEVELIPIKVQEHRLRPTQRPQYNTSPAPSTTSSSLYRTAVTTQATPTLQRARIATTSSTRVIPNRTDRPHSVAITPRPAQYISLSSGGSTTERPGVVYASRPSAGLNQQRYNYAAQQLERYVNTVGINVPTSQRSTSNVIPTTDVKEGIYASTELVYDPTTGRFNNQIYRQHQTPSLAATRQQQIKVSPAYGQQQNLAGNPQVPNNNRPQQAIYRQKQAELLAQSQQLYAQQRTQQQQPIYNNNNNQRYQLLESRDDPNTAYYYVQAPLNPSATPSGLSSAATSGGGSPHGALSVGQIDQFLRGSAVGF